MGKKIWALWAFVQFYPHENSLKKFKNIWQIYELKRKKGS